MAFSCPRPSIGRLYRRMNKKRRASLCSRGMVRKGINKQGKRVVPGPHCLLNWWNLTALGIKYLWKSATARKGLEDQSWRKAQPILKDMAQGYWICTSQSWFVTQLSCHMTYTPEKHACINLQNLRSTMVSWKDTCTEQWTTCWRMG